MSEISKHLIKRARKLRKEMTPTERLLWNALRNSSFAGLKFRRQHPVGFYVADFCCSREKLIIELDGDSHDFSESKDDNRTVALAKEGYRVFRFSDAEVLDNLDCVLMEIARMLDVDWKTAIRPPKRRRSNSMRNDKTTSPHPNPLPEGEGTVS